MGKILRQSFLYYRRRFNKRLKHEGGRGAWQGKPDSELILDQVNMPQRLRYPHCHCPGRGAAYPWNPLSAEAFCL